MSRSSISTEVSLVPELGCQNQSFFSKIKKIGNQAGAELGQAQHQLELGFTLSKV